MRESEIETEREGEKDAEIDMGGWQENIDTDDPSTPPPFSKNRTCNKKEEYKRSRRVKYVAQSDRSRNRVYAQLYIYRDRTLKLSRKVLCASVCRLLPTRCVECAPKFTHTLGSEHTDLFGLTGRSKYVQYL